MRLALYGCGRRTQSLVASVADRVRVAAGFDLHAPAAERAVAEHGGRAFTDLPSFLDFASGHADAFVISLFPKHHAQALLAVAPLGKPVYLEKPIATTPPDARRVVEAVRRQNLVCHVGFLHRHVPVFRKVTELIQSGEVGELLGVHVDWLTWAGAAVRGDHPDWRNDPATGGELLQHLGHQFDLLRHWGGEFRRVMAMSHRALWPQCPSENHLAAALEYRDRPAIASLRQSLVSRLYIIKGCVHGTKLTVEYEWRHHNSNLRLYRPGPQNHPAAVQDPSEAIGGFEPYVTGGPVDRALMLEFLDEAAGRKPVTSGVEDGLAALNLSWAIRQSADTGQAVELA